MSAYKGALTLHYLASVVFVLKKVAEGGEAKSGCFGGFSEVEIIYQIFEDGGGVSK